jgi:hypothetical protein
MTPLIQKSIQHLPAIHAATKIQFLSKTRSGQQLYLGGHVQNVFERKGNHYAVVDGLMVDEKGAALSQMRHTTIFNIRTTDSPSSSL